MHVRIPPLLTRSQRAGRAGAADGARAGRPGCMSTACKHSLSLKYSIPETRNPRLSPKLAELQKRMGRAGAADGARAGRPGADPLLASIPLNIQSLKPKNLDSLTNLLNCRSAWAAQGQQMERVLDDLEQIHFSMKKANQVLRDMTRSIATDRRALLLD